MYLTGPEIVRQMELGAIDITPWSGTCGPNSIDLHLGDTLLGYKWVGRRSDGKTDQRISVFEEGHERSNFYGVALDAKNPPETYEIPKIGPEFQGAGGWLIIPGNLYIGRTLERVRSDGFVPFIHGRSSFGRLGVTAHVTAGVGDDGFDGTWTLEIEAVEPVVIYPGGRYFQCLFAEVVGERKPYVGRYQGQVEPTPSRIHLPDGPVDPSHG